MLDERERLLAGDRLADTLRDMLDSYQQLLGCIEAKLQPTLVSRRRLTKDIGGDSFAYSPPRRCRWGIRVGRLGIDTHGSEAPPGAASLP